MRHRLATLSSPPTTDTSITIRTRITVLMKPRSIASNLATLSLGAFLSACGGADIPDGSEPQGDDVASELMSSYDEVTQEVTACDDNQYDHWRYLSALAVASANELGRWDVSDFAKVGGKIQLSSTGLARCSSGCENITGILQMQNDETRVVPRHDPGLLRQYMIAFYDRQVNWNRTNPIGAYSLTFSSVSDDVCGLRYHFNVGGAATNSTAGLAGTTELKPTSQYRCMDVVGVSSSDGATVQQHTCGGGANQKFTVEHQGNNTYRLKANHSGKCLGVVNNATWDGALLEQRSCGANNSQLFHMNSKGNGLYELRNVNSGKCVDVQSGGLTQGALMQLYSCHGGANQTFATSGLGTSSGTSTSSAPGVNPASLWSRLKLFGEHDNRYLMFQSTATQVSIDPMGTLVSGGSSSSSGACIQGATTLQAGVKAGDCCVVAGRYGKFAASPWNTKMFYCK